MLAKLPVHPADDHRDVDPLLSRYTAFEDARAIASGSLPDVACAVALRMASARSGLVMVFDDATGHAVDLDLRGEPGDVAARYAPRSEAGEVVAESRGRGRPRLGVVAREVTLLPRHWEWLATQPGGASVALRRLVETARRDRADADARRVAREAAYRVLHALGGDRPGFEDASRALFAGDSRALEQALGDWPADVRAYVMRLEGGVAG